MKQTFRVPVRELLEPFYTDRADPQDLARFTRWGAFGKMLQVAGLWLIVVFTAFELICFFCWPLGFRWRDFCWA